MASIQLMGLKLYFILIATIVLMTMNKHNTCKGFDVYFPMSSVKVNLPINEKSQSIFSKLPIGKFNVLTKANNSPPNNFVYNLEQNELLRIDSKSGEVYMKYLYQPIKKATRYIISSFSKGNSLPAKATHMTLEVDTQLEELYCKNLENVCFYENVHYALFENPSNRPFQPIELGALNARGAKFLCPVHEIQYRINEENDYFSLQKNIIYTKAPLDHENITTSVQNSLKLKVACLVTINAEVTKTFEKTLNITIIDRNDNGPMLQSNQTYNFYMDNPHFKMNQQIGEKIIFFDKDSLVMNAHTTYSILNDTHNFVKAICTPYEADHTGQKNTITSCQIIFSRNGLFSEDVYCFILEANDDTVDRNVRKNEKAQICLHADTSKIHETDRPLALALRTKPYRKNANIAQLGDGFLERNDNNGKGIVNSIAVTYTKDVHVYRSAMPFHRVTQPEESENIMRMNGMKFNLAEDRSNAFGITRQAGIIYIKDAMALEHAPETVYFLNVTWFDNYQHFFVINVHLVEGRPKNSSCEQKVKSSRSLTCAQIKYQKQCVKFCGLGTNGGTCMWRGSNSAIFSSNYGSCVPDAKYCPDNICDPLEELNTFICPQDCTPKQQIMGPYSPNRNGRGILSASGTCICDDTSKCSCAPLDDDEPKPKRKRKNESKSQEQKEKISAAPISSNRNVNSEGNNDVQEGMNVAGFVCDKSCMIVGITCPIVILVLIICFIISRKNLQHRRLGKETMTTQKNVIIINGDCDVRNGDLPLIELENSFKFDTGDSKWEFDREKLILDAVLGEGEFGKVVKGYATDIAGMKGTITVAVKMLKKGANSVEYMALLSEFQLLQEVSHPNVIKLLGACTKGDTPMIIIEYARYGSLRSYLRLSRKIECSGVEFTDGVEPVTVKNILTFAWQICKGMAYLTEIKLVHRDLAARNVLLADGKICKISDFGLTRDVYEDDAYLKRSRDRVPVKWMAPESLADHVYTTKSDVWAFGVLCWELITLGASPYPGVPPQNLYHLLKSGYRMEKPENCSEDIYSIIRSCWTDDPNVRPSFKYLASQFEKLLGNNVKYIEFESSAVSNPSYGSDEINLDGHSKEFSPNGLSTFLQPNVLTKLIEDYGEPDCLDHLWRPPKICYDTGDCPNSRDFSTTLSVEFQPPPGYDMPRPLIETSTTEQILRYENDLRFPLNIRKSSCETSFSTVERPNSQKLLAMAQYAVPMKRGRSYMDMTNKTFIPDNLDSSEFEKNVTKTISFRFSSLLNLQEQDQESTA